MFPLYFPLKYQAFQWLGHTEMLACEDRAGACGCSPPFTDERRQAVLGGRGGRLCVLSPTCHPVVGLLLQAGLGLAPATPFRVTSQPADWGVCRPTATCVCRPFHLSVLLLTKLHQKVHSLVVQWIRVRASKAGARVQSVVGELGSHMLRGVAGKKTKQNKKHLQGAATPEV